MEELQKQIDFAPFVARFAGDDPVRRDAFTNFYVQAAVPQCRVVAALHHLPAKELGHLDSPIDSDVLICGDDKDAVRITS